jgi:hypothetical protein
MLTMKRFLKSQFAIILFACLCGVLSSSALAGPNAIANQKELNAALKTAKSTEDHQRIAAYYQEQSQKFQNKAKEEQELADYFLAHPSMYGKIYPTPYENHKWRANHYNQAAKQAAEKADFQVKLATESQSQSAQLQ